MAKKSKNSMKDVESAVDDAIDGPRDKILRPNDGFNSSFKMQFGNGPMSDKMYGPGDGIPNPDRERMIAAQKAVMENGTDGDIEEYSRARSGMGQPMDESGGMGSPDRAMAHELNQAWMRFNAAPTDGNGQALREIMDKHGIESSFGEDMQ